VIEVKKTVYVISGVVLLLLIIFSGVAYAPPPLQARLSVTIIGIENTPDPGDIAWDIDVLNTGDVEIEVYGVFHNIVPYNILLGTLPHHWSPNDRFQYRVVQEGLPAGMYFAEVTVVGRYSLDGLEWHVITGSARAICRLE
jgi:hypothetical protein